jgi:hypothetical protein
MEEYRWIREEKMSKNLSVLELAFWISNILGRDIVSVAQGAGKEQQ